ncbi:MAG: tmk 1, partial [Mycobacterium sp.]|nr:tmk 1 [Mycobacterium sp.]
MPIKGPSDIYGYLRLLGPDSRLHFLFHALHLALQRAREQRPQLLLLDGYWFKYFAADVAHGADPVVLRNLAVSFPIPDMTFHLVLGTDEALSRKTNRSDYENGFSDGAQDFLAFQGRMRVVLQGLARDLGWIEVDARRRPADITTSMIEQIEVCHGFTG